ncbi:hypothetical protein [Ralstonia phage RP12]|uniref:Uncharacterized protein n=1 Tax=Ralstonia phage RP12 TaxID=1923889 RepID=A0A1L7N0P3_9CAUD|nr:hypothetical protein FDH28_gp052 [Ralstonia phage RP12]BAW19026.1 hypothetical protein [Ralstonia phage RP12]
MTNSAHSTVESTPQPTAEAAVDNTTGMTSMILGEAGDHPADTENIYFDLDTILDTRLGTLAQMGTEHAVSALNSGRYHKRMIDEFDDVPKQVFREAYAKRNIDTLKQSVLTNLVYFLRRLIKDSLLQAVVQQKVEKMCFTVNVWPYDFKDAELVEMLIGCIRFHTYSTSSVRIVSIPNEDLTPEFCNKNFQIMIRYNWIDWCDKHKAFFEENGIPGMTIVVPEIFYDSVPTMDDIDRLDLKKQSPFKMTEAICARLFRLKHMPVSLFSIHEAIRKENAAEVASRVAVTQNDIEEFLDTNYPKAERIRETPLPDVDLTEAFELL